MIKKFLIFTLVIAMLIPTICNVNVQALGGTTITEEDRALIDTFTDGVFGIGEDYMFVDLVELLGEISDPIGFSEAYANALGQLTTSQQSKIDEYKLTSYAVVGFTNFMKDADFSISALDDYLDNEDKEGFAEQIEERYDEFKACLEETGVDEIELRALKSGFAVMNNIFNTVKLLDLFEHAISDHKFYIAKEEHGYFKLDRDKVTNFIVEMKKNDSLNDILNVMEEFIDYYNDASKKNKKLIYDYLNKYKFINLDPNAEIEIPSGEIGGSIPIPPVEEPIPTDDLQNNIEEKAKVEIKPVITSAGTLEATVKSTDLSDAWKKTKSVLEEVKEETANTNKSIQSKVVLEVPESKEVEKVDISLPVQDIKDLEKDGLDLMQINSQVGTVEFNTSSIIEEGQIAKEIKFTMETVSDIPNDVPENSIVVDFNLSVDGKKVSKFKSPIKVSIPYEPKETENLDEITVYFIQPDGNSIPVGGIYNTITKKVEFTTNHFSKYYAKTSRKSFNDVKTDYWAKDYIEILAGKGIINGKGNDSFDPYADITRAEFVALITRMLNLVQTDEEIPFTDIIETAWYADEIPAAYQIGLINGRSNTKFVPNDPITRQEASVVITNTLSYLGYNTEGDAKLIDGIFNDYDNIASWARNAVSTTYREKIINGKPNNLFDPTGNTTRAEVAKMIYILFKK